jgi:NADPH-dependent 2,4-dienoyl-CoA reductase/sulfur reductase-like enzyme
MNAPGLVVVGASLAGLRAVEAARRSGFDGTVTLIGAEPHLPYDRPPLSKQFLTGEVAAPRFFRSAQSLRTGLGIDLRLGAAATTLHPDQRTVAVGDEEIGYTGLVIATGATARDLPGMPRLAGVHTLRTLDDALALRHALQPGSRVVIIGAGFIGSEVPTPHGAGAPR